MPQMQQEHSREDKEEQEQICKAIAETPVAQLRELLTDLVKGNKSAQEVASKYLLRPAVATAGTTSSKKRKAYEVCVNCGATFDVVENEPSSCRHHPGEKEVYEDDDFWADEDYPGQLEDLIDDPNMAGGFMWNCCDKLGNGEGCTVSTHLSPEDEAKRPRVEEWPASLEQAGMGSA